jgi:geranylgeranyl diphosphate synthase type I
MDATGVAAVHTKAASPLPPRTRARPRPAAPDPGRRAEERILRLLDEEHRRWSRQQPDLASLFDELRLFVARGGKRLRPSFCFWGAVSGGADPDDPQLDDAGGALELLHAFALIHDDVMDGSDRRRGAPTVHRVFEEEHRRQDLHGEPRRYGEGLAVLAGDLAFVYADGLVAMAPAPAREVWQRLRVELTMGQWIDLVGAARRDRSPQRARWVAAYKSGRYTVERPLQLGAALAGRPDLARPYSQFGRPLGQAFQLRDDLLGALGDPACTGKPVGDDLREGKPTPLIAIATDRATDDDRELLARLGSADLTDRDVDELQALFVRTGALDDVEAAIERLVVEARTALAEAPITETARAWLDELAAYVAWRDS